MKYLGRTLAGLHPVMLLILVYFAPFLYERGVQNYGPWGIMGFGIFLLPEIASVWVALKSDDAGYTFACFFVGFDILAAGIMVLYFSNPGLLPLLIFAGLLWLAVTTCAGRGWIPDLLKRLYPGVSYA